MEDYNLNEIYNFVDELDKNEYKDMNEIFKKEKIEYSSMINEEIQQKAKNFLEMDEINKKKEEMIKENEE